MNGERGTGERGTRRTGRAFPVPRSSFLVLPLLVFLGACSGIGAPDHPTTARTASDTADQVMSGVHMTLTNLGVKQAEIEADSAWIYEGPGRTELKHVKLTFYSPTGVQQSVLTSDEGTYMTRTDSMEARGHVVVVKTDGSRLTTTVLRYNRARNEVTTDQPYTYDATDRHITGVAFKTDPSLNNITTTHVQGKGGGFRLPGN